MAKNKKTITKSPNRTEYDKQRERILRAITRLEKEGYYLPAPILPPIPERVTQNRIRELKAITPKVIREESYLVVDTEIVKDPAYNIIPKPSLPIQDEPFSETDYDVTSTEVAPFNFNIFDRITDLIEAIPSEISCKKSDGRYGTWEWQNDYPLMQIFISAMQTYDNNELAEYYMSVESELVGLLTPSHFPSTQEAISRGFSQASIKLNGGHSLTAEQSKILGDSFGV